MHATAHCTVAVQLHPHVCSFWVSDRKSRAPDRRGVGLVVNRLKERGFLAGSAGSLGNVLKLRPPLVFSRDNADLFLDAFSETLRELHG